jgi:hypothetical protein
MSVPWGRAAAVATAVKTDTGEWAPITSAMEVRAIYTNTVGVGDTWAMLRHGTDYDPDFAIS